MGMDKISYSDIQKIIYLQKSVSTFILWVPFHLSELFCVLNL